jgi:hypothetical protein
MARHCKIYKVTLRWDGHFGRMNNERLSKQSTDCQNGRNEEKRKTMEKEVEDVEENFKTTGIRNWHTVAKDWNEYRTGQDWKPRSRTDCSARGGGGG